MEYAHMLPVHWSTDNTTIDESGSTSKSIQMCINGIPQTASKNCCCISYVMFIQTCLYVYFIWRITIWPYIVITPYNKRNLYTRNTPKLTLSVPSIFCSPICMTTSCCPTIKVIICDSLLTNFSIVWLYLKACNTYFSGLTTDLYAQLRFSTPQGSTHAVRTYALLTLSAFMYRSFCVYGFLCNFRLNLLILWIVICVPPLTLCLCNFRVYQHVHSPVVNIEKLRRLHSGGALHIHLTSRTLGYNQPPLGVLTLVVCDGLLDVTCLVTQLRTPKQSWYLSNIYRYVMYRKSDFPRCMSCSALTSATYRYINIQVDVWTIYFLSNDDSSLYERTLPVCISCELISGQYPTWPYLANFYLGSSIVYQQDFSCRHFVLCKSRCPSLTLHERYTLNMHLELSGV